MYEPAIYAPIPFREPISTFTDEDLIAELKRRGYRVAKPECIRTFGAEARYSDAYLTKISVESFEAFVRRSLVNSIGGELLHTGAVELTTGVTKGETAYRAALTVLVPPKA